ncbi:hypothetical protein RhiirA1_405294, partial [Rhizophagus irregularis]
MERLMRQKVRQTKTDFTFQQIIGQSHELEEVKSFAKRATRTNSNVLIIGETGTGKELFAQSIHAESDRATGPFITQNCAALPDSLIEGILFGTTKGSFTGAIDNPGLFELAQGGTLLLDELNSLNFALQAKLLRVLQERKVRRIGGSEEIPVDVRVIATGVSKEVSQFFVSHSWPGNVRELEHVIEASMNLINYEDRIEMHHLPYQYRR